MNVLIVVGVVAVVCLLAIAERVVKRRRRARQRRQMAYRLTVAAARAEVAERNRKAAVAASAELTSVIPAINHPQPTFDGIVKQSRRLRAARQHHTGPQRLGTGPQRLHASKCKNTTAGHPANHPGLTSGQNDR